MQQRNFQAVMGRTYVGTCNRAGGERAGTDHSLATSFSQHHFFGSVRVVLVYTHTSTAVFDERRM